MSNFLPLKGNCPVCNGTRKDCRQSKSTGLVHCLNSVANPSNYLFRGTDKLGFGMWAQKSEVEAASQQQRQEWRQQREREKQRRLDAERAQRSQLLSEPDRDREIRKLFAQLDLWPRHREDLRQRGLSDEQIQAGMFRSVQKWQKLDTPVSPRLAGVNIDGRSLNNYDSGYLCPIWNPHGQIIGWQLRLDNTNKGKYHWPTSFSENRPNGATAHLTNGELPLTVARPSGDPQNQGLVLAEGILKPQIIAQLSGQVTLGASGGNFASSPLTFKAILPELEPEIGGKPIALSPDAGAILNKNVMRQYQRNYDLLKELGHQMSVLWWHQTSKDDLDLDEMLAAGRGNEIEEISWEQFKAIALWHRRWKKRQERSLTYTANVVLDTPDLSTIGLQVPDSGIIAIKSAKGSGKTKLISQLTAHSESLLSLTHRIFLGRSLSQRLGYTWRTDADKGAGYYLDSDGQPTCRLGSCVESLLAINPQEFVGCDLVIDEACQVVRNILTSSTCNRDGMRPALLARLHWLIKVAKRIILDDADLDDFTLNYIRALRGEDAPVYLVRNDYKSGGYPCRIYNSHDHAAIIDYAVSSAQLGKRLFIGTDSKNASQVMAELAVAGVKPDHILVVNGDTSGEQQQREYISQINHRISDYDVVIATSSLATGVSFELEWFDEVIGVFYGVVPDSDVAQALARVRVPIPRTIWIAKQGKNFNKVSKSESPSVVKRTLKTGWEREVALIRSSLNPDLVPHVDAPVDWDNCPHKNLWAQTVAENNFSMWNLRDCVIARLKQEGNQVQVISPDTGKDFKEVVKEVKQEIKTNHCNQVSHATVLSGEEQESLQSKEGLSTQERLNLEKTAIAQFTCSSEVSPELVAAYPELVATIPRYEDLRHNLAIERDEKAISRQVKWKQGLFIPDLPTREQERLLRERLGLIKWIDKLRQGETLTNEDLEPLGELVRNGCHQVNEVLRLGFSSESKNWSNVRIFNALVKQLGIPTVTKRVGKETKITSTSLDLKRWGLVEEILERREAKRQEKTEPMVMEEKQFQVDNGSYINKQVPLSTNTVAPSAQIEETKQVWGDNGSYINKQVPLSPPSNAIPVQIEVEPALSQEDIAELADFLMTADTPEVVMDVFGMIQWVCKETKQAKEVIQAAKKAIWALIPREKRAQLWEMAATG